MEKLFGLLQGEQYYNKMHRLICHFCFYSSIKTMALRYHEHDFLGTTLWSTDTKGNLVKDYQDTTIFGEGSIQHDRSARFTGKPYDEDSQAYVFPYRNYDASTARWRSSDPAGYPDGVNNRFYAAVPTTEIDIWGNWVIELQSINVVADPIISYVEKYGDKSNVKITGTVSFIVRKESSDVGKLHYTFEGGSGNAKFMYFNSIDEGSFSLSGYVNVLRGVGDYDTYVKLNINNSIYSLSGTNFVIQVEN